MDAVTYKEIKLKDGTIIRKDVPIEIFPIKNQNTICLVKIKDKSYRMKYITVVEPPGKDELQEYISDSSCTSVSGETVEPDGHDEHGFPSWLLALGLM